MFGLFQLFGPSKPQRRLDAAVRELGLHPRLVPDAVKIAIIRMLEERDAHGGATEAACAEVAELLTYLMHGSEVFTEDNGAAATRSAEGRITAAIAAGAGPDARIILLALHAGLVTPEVIDAFGLEID